MEKKNIGTEDSSSSSRNISSKVSSQKRYSIENADSPVSKRRKSLVGLMKSRQQVLQVASLKAAKPEHLIVYFKKILKQKKSIFL